MKNLTHPARPSSGATAIDAAFDAEIAALLAQLAEIEAADRIAHPPAATSAPETCAHNRFRYEGQLDPAQASYESFPPPPKKTRGKAKPSTCITAKAAVNLLNGAAFASSIGLHLNTSVTINAACSTRCASGPGFWRRINLSLASFAEKHDIPLAYAFALENPPKGGQGLHAHVLLHLPADRHAALRAALAVHLTAVFAWRPRRPGYVPLNIKEKVLKPDDTTGCMVYTLKGIDPRVTTYRRLNGQGPEPQGTIHGKRAGLSQSIDQAARRQAGYPETATLDDLDLSHLRPRKIVPPRGPVTPGMFERQIAMGVTKSNVRHCKSEVSDLDATGNEHEGTPRVITQAAMMHPRLS